MNIVERNKDKIQDLIKVVSANSGRVDSLSVEITEENLEPFLPFMLHDFPYAVNPDFIANPKSKEDQKTRANGMLRLVVGDQVKGKFLDFGCGSGYVPVETCKKAFSVGYDIEKQEDWNSFAKNEKLVLTNDWDEVIKHAPYNMILIYDVLDHVNDEQEAIECLKKVASVLDNKGKVYLRCHPFCSRHGTHLYLSINRAYLHLCMDESTLDKLGYKYLHTLKLIHPIMAYERWFREAELIIDKKVVIPENIEPFFYQPGIASLIKRHWKKSHDENLSSGRSFPEYQLRQQFVDFCLVKIL